MNSTVAKTNLCNCHGWDPKDCPVWIAFDAAMTWAQSKPVERVTNLFGFISAGVFALELKGRVRPLGDMPEAANVDPLLLELAEAHRPQYREVPFARDAFGQRVQRQVSCRACNTGWRHWAPGMVPYRCDTWQQLLEKGIVRE